MGDRAIRWRGVGVLLGRILPAAMFLVPPSLWAAPGAGFRTGAPFSFRRLMPENGLPAATVNAIFQDSRGFIWSGTADGLARYDGYEFRVFRHDPENPESLVSQSVRDICEDGSGNLWLATDAGLDLWHRDNERFTHYRHSDADPSSLAADSVTSVLIARDKTLWIGTDGGGIDRFDFQTGTFGHLRSLAGGATLSDDRVLSIFEDHEGRIWIGTETGGINRFDPASRELRFFGNESGVTCSLSRSRVPAFAEDRDGRVWFATDKGLCRLEPGDSTARQFAGGAGASNAGQASSVTKLIADREGRIWFGTDGGGLGHLDPASGAIASFRSDRQDNRTPASDVITALLEDREGDLWVGHGPVGISYGNLLTSAFRNFRTASDLGETSSDNPVWAFAEEPDGSLWVGTDGGGLFRLDARSVRWNVFRNEPGNPRSLGANSITSLCLDSAARLWVGTWNGGLCRLDPGARGFRCYRDDPKRTDSIGSDRIWRIVEDGRNQVWIGTATAGVARYDPATDGFVHYRHHPADTASLSHDNVLCLLATRAGQLWAGTVGGLSLRNSATASWQRFDAGTSRDGTPSHKMIVDLFEDRRGLIWIATQGGGLNRYDPASGEFTVYRATDGLPSDLVRSILEDEDGILWISTNQGLARFDPSTSRFRIYDTDDGPQDTLFNRGARIRGRTGELLFGGTRGYTSFRPKDVRIRVSRPPLVLTRFEIFNQVMEPLTGNSPLTRTITETRDLSILARQSVISFRFAALSYQSPGKNRYEFRLEGFDKGWRKAGPERHANYTNLDPGSYRLHVRAANSDGIWNEEGVSLAIIVVPPFWRTWWFTAACVLLFAFGLIAAGSSIAGRRLREQLREAGRERQLALVRQAAAEELRRRERNYLEIFDSTEDAIILRDTQTGTVLDANAAAVRMFGYPKEELLRKSIGDLSAGVEPYTQRAAEENMRQAMSSGARKFEWLSKRASGETFCSEVQLTRSQIGGENRSLAVIRDITERKRIEEERLRLERQMLQTQKLESLGILAGGIAHDFNNLLVGILGNADLALRDLSPLSPVRGNLDEIEKAARRAADLCRQMLAYSGKGRFVIESIRLDELINEMLYLLKSSIRKGTVLRLELADNLPPLKGDATQIRQTVMNLVINAAEAIGDRSGYITISTGAARYARDELSENLIEETASDDLYVWMEVSDTGCGMDESTQRRIFEPFFTTKFAGRGLGLSAVLGIVRGHKGLMRVSSAPNQGTTFRISFPAAEEQPAGGEAKTSEVAEWKASGTILLVDDEETVRTLAMKMLKRIGFEVIMARDGREAIELYRTRQAEISLVLLDMTMPHMNGETTLRELHRIDPSVRVLMSSGFAGTDLAARFEGMGLAGFVQKPYSLDDLRRRIQSALTPDPG